MGYFMVIGINKNKLLKPDDWIITHQHFYGKVRNSLRWFRNRFKIEIRLIYSFTANILFEFIGTNLILFLFYAL